MNIGTHVCAPVLAALLVDTARLSKGRDRVFSAKSMLALAIAGGLPDILDPHLSLSARYSSWTHTLWFLLAVYPIYGILSRILFHRRWLLLTHWFWFATIFHLSVDTLSNGIRPLYPYGPIINYPVIPWGWYWLASDLVLITATLLLAIWLKRRYPQNALTTPRKGRALKYSVVLALVAVVLLLPSPAAKLLKLVLRKDPAANLPAMKLALKPDSGSHGTRDLSTLIEPIRAKFYLPSLAAIVLQDGKVIAEGICGVRRAGGKEPITEDDLFSMGADTTAMTATLIAVLVEDGSLKWTTTLGDVFSRAIPGMDSNWKNVTLEQLLLHRAGAPSNLDANTRLLTRVLLARGTLIEQRSGLLEAVVTAPPDYPPGSRSANSVLDYSIAAAMAEKVTGRAWEELIQERVFRPLGIFSAGFGMPGKPGGVGQPRGHEADGTPVESGIRADTPAMLGPAGSVYMTMRDWAKFVLAHLRGDERNPKRRCVLLRAESYDKLHTPEGSFAMGWNAAAHEWAKGSAENARGAILMQEGSNYLWRCCAWLAPERDYAVMVATNQAGSSANAGVLEAAAYINSKLLK